MGAIKKSSVFAAAFVGLFAGSARAEGIVTAKVPFPFVIGRQEFPAGHYDIRTEDFSGTVVVIRGTDNRSASFALTIPADGRDPAGDQPALVFTRYENQYRLSQIWESSGEGRALRVPSATSKAARAGMETGPSALQTYVLDANWK